MGNLGLGRPPLDEEEQKAGFRACLERTCVPQVQKVLQLRSANSVGAQFQMVTAGRAETRPDPVNSDIAKQASDADARLLECERQCARRYWPDALEQSWLGTVSVDMAGIARDQTRGNSRTGRFTWAPAVKMNRKKDLGGSRTHLSLTHQSRLSIRNHPAGPRSQWRSLQLWFLWNPIRSSPGGRYRPVRGAQVMFAQAAWEELCQTAVVFAVISWS